MSDWMELHLAAPVAANLAGLGWTPAHPRVRDVVAPTPPGPHAGVVAPPVPGWSGPALAGMMSHLLGEPGRRAVLVAPPESVAEWARLAGRLGEESGLRVVAARGPGRATRLLRSDPPGLLIVSADLAAGLVARGDLQTATLSGIVLAWPERWADDTLLIPLMQDLPREAQRVVLSADPARAAEVAERYAWKGVTAGPPAGRPVGPVRTVAVAWERRAAAVAELVELLDPEQVAVWTVDELLHAELRSAMAGAAPGFQIGIGIPEAPAGTIIAVDLPDPATLQALLAAGEVVLLVPPGAERWIEHAATPRRPILLPGPVDAAHEEARRRRAAIRAAMTGEEPIEAALVLAPLFERYEAPAVAAALYRLWTRTTPDAPPPPPPAADGGTERLWIGAGRRDNVTTADLVALLTRELEVDRSLVGRVEIRESYSLIEVPRDEAQRLAEAVSGRTLRQRRLAARVDRGPPPERPKRDRRPG